MVEYLSGWPKIAKALSVSKATAKRWHKKSQMNISRAPGGTPIISLEALRDWVNSKKEEAGK